MRTHALNLLAKVTSTSREAILWEPSRVSYAGFPSDSPIEIVSLQTFPDLTSLLTKAEPERVGLSIILQLGGLEEEIARAVAASNDRTPINLLSLLAGESKRFPLDSTATIKIRPVAIDRGIIPLRGRDKIVVYGAVSVSTEGNYQSLDSSNRSATVSEAGGEIASENRKRVTLSIVNEGNSQCWINFGRLAVARTGILLNPGGSAYEINSGNPWFGSIGAICRSGETTHLSICEVSYR